MIDLYPFRLQHLKPGVVALHGELDAHSARFAAQDLTDVVDGGDDLEVQTHGVTFIDSAGLELLEQVVAHVAATGGAVRFPAASGTVRRIVGLTGCTTIDVCTTDA